MIVAVIAARPASSGRCPRGAAGRSRPTRPPRPSARGAGLGDRRARRSRSTLAIRNVVVSVCAGSSSPASSKPKPREGSTGRRRRWHRRRRARRRARGRPSSRPAPPRRGRRGPSRPGANACSRSRAPASRHQPLPDHLEVLGMIGHPGPRAVRVRPLDDRPEGAQRGDDVVADAADHLARRASPACRSRRTCRGRPCSCRPGTAASRRAGPTRPPRAAAIAALEPAEPAPTTHISTSADAAGASVRLHGSASCASRRARPDASSLTDQPPSILST